MKKVFFSGHRDFGNHGCEAIVRSTVSLLHSSYPDTKFIVPSTNIARDRAFWPDHQSSNVEFVDCLAPNAALRFVNKARKYIMPLNELYSPGLLSSAARRCIDDADLVLAVGGDNYSDDYALPFVPTILDRYALARGKPVYLWGASVGPFDNRPRYRDFIARHLGRFDGVLVREDLSEAYCRSRLRLANVARVADPAFGLDLAEIPPQLLDSLPRLDQAIAVNVSPLILRKMDEAGRQALLSNLAQALRDVVAETGWRVVLLSHVNAYASPNRDDIALRQLQDVLQGLQLDCVRVEEELSAPQLKWLISRCGALIAARTHATIAAMSTGTPVVSIGYSVKAVGINDAVFGHRDFVLDYRRLTREGVRDTMLRALRGGRYADSPRVLDQRQLAKTAAAAVGRHLAAEPAH